MVFISELWLVPAGLSGCKGARGSGATCLMLNSFCTFHSGAAVMEVVVLGPFGNFQFGFWLESFGAQVFWWEVKN